LKQIGLGWHNYADEQGFFPPGTGGVPSYLRPGQPRPFRTGVVPIGSDPTGSWMFQLLPYVDQNSVWLQNGAADADEASIRVLTTPIPTYVCPSRPRPKVLEVYSSEWPLGSGYKPGLYFPPRDRVHAVGDYCANDGRDPLSKDGVFPSNEFPGVLPIFLTWVGTRSYADVTDGLSTTLLAGESRLHPKYHYQPHADDSYAFQATSYAAGERSTATAKNYTEDGRNAPFPPAADSDRNTEYRLGYRYFGSAHPASMSAVFLDGSVRSISYRIDPTVWVNICGIADGHVVPGDF
jgi:uncharacterized protein DUF1559